MKNKKGKRQEKYVWVWGTVKLEKKVNYIMKKVRKIV